MPTVYVLTWRYSDNSGGGVIRAFASEADADELAELLRAYAETRQYEVVQIPLQVAS